MFFFVLPAKAQFEGIIESKNITTDGMGRPQEFIMTMWIKQNMVKIETSGGSLPGSTMIYRTDKRKIWMLNDEEKTYFEIPQDEKAQEVYSPGGAPAKYTIKKTSSTKTIAGYACQQFIIRRGSEETQIWGTKKLNHLVNAISKALGQEHTDAAEGATHEVMKMGMYPMMSVTKIGGNLIESQEVTRIEVKTLEASLFELPAGFTKQKSLDMMQGIQNGKK